MKILNNPSWFLPLALTVVFGSSALIMLITWPLALEPKLPTPVIVSAIPQHLIELGVPLRAQLRERYGALPLSFEANQGQAPEEVRFLTRGQGYDLFLTAQDAILALDTPSPPLTLDHADPAQSDPVERTLLRMQLLGAQKSETVHGVQPLPGKSHYFIGNDPAHWHTDVPTYTKVRYPQVYPGIDLVYYGKQRQLEYDFIVAPGADPQRIRLAFEGAESMRIDEQGDLILATAAGELTQHKPVIYQEKQGRRTSVAGEYVLFPAPPLAGEEEQDDEQPWQVGFQLAAYDTSQPVVIDPVLTYSTYLGGGNGDNANGIAVDGAGNAYVIGETFGSFPVTPGAFDRTFEGSSDILIAKFNTTGTALIYATYLGSSGNDGPPEDIAVDAEGNVYVTGVNSGDFPTTPGAFDRDSIRGDGFVTKLNAAGNALIYSTFLGGSDMDQALGIAMDSAGHVYVTGGTRSRDFPLTQSAVDTTFAEFTSAFVTKLNPGGTGLIYSTLLSGSRSDVGENIVVDAIGNAYVTGTVFSSDFPTTPGAFDTICGDAEGRCSTGADQDIFITKLNADGTGLIYSTFLAAEAKNPKIAIDHLGQVYLTGRAAPPFPLVNAIQPTFNGIRDTFLLKLNATGSALLFSTFLGGSNIDDSQDIAVDSAGNVYVVGDTRSVDFPTTPGAFDRILPPGTLNAYITKFTPRGALAYSTFLGGSGAVGDGIAVDDLGNVYVVGTVFAPDFPTTPGAFDRTCGRDGKCDDPMDGETPAATDVFVTKLPTRTCFGQAITMLGTPDNDVLTGTAGVDVIDGSGGDDVIDGLGGDDVLCGGFGNDTLRGNAGNDRLHGGRGNDRLFGNAGNDRLAGKGGNDALDGGAGVDVCNGEGVGTDPADIGADTAVRCERVDNVP